MFVKKIITFLFCSFLTFTSSFVSAFCFNEAGEKYNISPLILAAMAYTESSFNSKAINADNKNKSVDYGLMQINTFWLPHLKKMNINEDDLINDACLNVHVGAWVLAQNFKLNGDNWESIGAYNAGFRKVAQSARDRYIQIVKANLEYIKNNAS